MTQTLNRPAPLHLERRTSRLAVFGFVLSLLAVPIVGIPLCIGGLVDARYGRSGKELAIAGIAVGVLWSVLWVMAFREAWPAALADYRAGRL